MIEAPKTKMNIADCHEKAGYERDRGNATRLYNKPAVQERIRELQLEVQKSTKVTVESVCAQLYEAIEIAKRMGNPAAIVAAVAQQMKAVGLGADKVQMEVTHKYADEFPEGMQPKDILAKVVGFATGGLAWWHTVTEVDKAAIASYFEEAWVKAEQLCRVIEARAIDSANLPPAPGLPKPSPNPSLNGKSNGQTPSV
jgi:hypothetical protein